jgi:hypothetical protein
MSDLSTRVDEGEQMEVQTTKPTQHEAAYHILNNYHGPCVDEIKKVISTAKDLDELKIVGDLLRGTAEHLLSAKPEKTDAALAAIDAGKHE